MSAQNPKDALAGGFIRGNEAGTGHRRRSRAPGKGGELPLAIARGAPGA